MIKTILVTTIVPVKRYADRCDVGNVGHALVGHRLDSHERNAVDVARS